jgi:phosphatidylglycerol:prolipoprotein diacylglycerol transferase
MLPELFRFPAGFPLLGGKAIYSFGFFIGLSFVVSVLILQWAMDRKGLDGEKGWNILILALIGGVVGAKLYWAAWHMDELSGGGAGALFSGSGLTWYGGFLLATVMVLVGIRRMGLPMGKTLDAAALAMPVGIAVGRIGCFLVGDDYGRPTGGWYGVAFPRGAPPTRVDVLEAEYGITVDPELVARFGDVVPVHPTQLYEVVISLLVFAVIYRYRDHLRRPGWLFGLWLTLYGVQRFLLEIVRLKDDRIFFDVLTGAQLISLGIMAVGLAVVTRVGRSEPTAPGSSPA